MEDGEFVPLVEVEARAEREKVLRCQEVKEKLDELRSKRGRAKVMPSTGQAATGSPSSDD